MCRHIEIEQGEFGAYAVEAIIGFGNFLPQILRGLHATVRSALLIGHNPGMHELAVLLAGNSASGEAGQSLMAGFPTAALAEFSVAMQWPRLDAAGTRLVRFVRPRDLPEFAA